MAKIYQFPTPLPRGPRGMALIRKDKIWREKAYPEREWVVTDFAPDQYGRFRVTIEPVEDRTSETSYSESYFRRHFEPKVAGVLKKNSKAYRNFRASTKRGFQELVACVLKVDAGRGPS